MPPATRFGENSGSGGGKTEDAGRRGDPGPDARFEIAAHTRLHLRRAPRGLERVETEAQLLDPLPEVRVVDAAAVAVERVDHLEEAPLPAGSLGGRVQSRRAGVLAGNREVAEDEQAGPVAQVRPLGGAARAAEVGVDEAPLPLAVDVVLRSDRRGLGARQAIHAPSLS